MASVSHRRPLFCFHADSIIVSHSVVHHAAINKRLCMSVSNKHNVGQKKPGTKDYMHYVYLVRNEVKTTGG